MPVTTYVFPHSTVQVKMPDLTPAEQERWNKQFRKITKEFMQVILKYDALEESDNV